MFYFICHNIASPAISLTYLLNFAVSVFTFKQLFDEIHEVV